MQFLNPYWLFALPLIALPVLIHLLNQRRHKTIDWGAMQFLLTARKMNRGMARIKQILIMASRMLVIAGLIFMVSRPLASGWVGSLTGGRPETVIVLLDRSASMVQQDLNTGQTKLESGIRKIADALTTTGVRGPIVLIDSVNQQPTIVDRPESLIDLPATRTVDASAQIPELLGTALDYISENETGRTDIWLCSDGANNDWNPESSQWLGLNSGFQQLDGVRIQLLNFQDKPSENFAIKLDRFEKVTSAEGDELVVDLTVTRTAGSDGNRLIPVTFTINGIRSVHELELENNSATLIGHRIPIGAELESGWGHVEIPLDAQSADNHWYFSFANASPRKTYIISEDASLIRAVEIAASTSTGQEFEFESVVLAPDQISRIDWELATMIVWQAELPTEEQARPLRKFVESGRAVLFLPPEGESTDEFAGIRWGDWSTPSPDGMKVEYWNNDAELLRRTSNGTALPLDNARIYQQRELIGDETRLIARLENDLPLLSRLTTDGGAVYFLSTLPAATHSSLGRNGVTLFALIHRAIEGAAASQGAAKQLVVGSQPARQVVGMESVIQPSEDDGLIRLSAEKPFVAGVYRRQVDDVEKYVALNRTAEETAAYLLSREEVSKLFEGLDVSFIEGNLGTDTALASEIWRAFVVLMGLALLLEAVLCLPSKPEKAEGELQSVRLAA